MDFIKCIRCCILLLLSLGVVVATEMARADDGDTSATAPAEQVFAMVNGKPVTVREFIAQYRATLRKRYYHGEPPAAEVETVRKEVADSLIERALLVEEAERRGIQPEADKIEKFAADAEARYKNAPGWPKQLPGLKEQIARQSMFEQIEKAIRSVPPPDPAEVRAYYEQKPELFTEPEKLHLSVILLGVDPGAPREDWVKAREKAQEIYQHLKDGADFTELAHKYSADPSASNGGDLGYVHGGVLSEGLQDRLSKFQVGEIVEPITLLEGTFVYRIDDRIPAKLREFAEVEQRARDLLQRDQSEHAWKEITDRLREEAKIEILIPMGGEADTQKASMQETSQEATSQEATKQEATKQEATKQEGGKKKSGVKKGEKK